MAVPFNLIAAARFNTHFTEAQVYRYAVFQPELDMLLIKYLWNKINVNIMPITDLICEISLKEQLAPSPIEIPAVFFKHGALSTAIFFINSERERDDNKKRPCSPYAYWSLVGDEHVVELVEHEFPGGRARVGFAKEWEYRCHDPFHAANGLYKMRESRLNPEVIPAYYRQYDPYVEMLVEKYRVIEIVDRSTNLQAIKGWDPAPASTHYCNVSGLTILPPCAPLGSIVLN